MKLWFMIVGFILFVYGGILCIFSNINLGVIMVVGLGAFFILWGMLYEKINVKTGPIRYAKPIMLSLLVLEFVLVGFLGIYGISDNVTYREDAVVVLGAGIRGDKITLPLKLRLDKAIEYNRKNPNALIVVSGGQGFQETVTEAFAMEKYLLKNGIDKANIIKEERATSTNENMRFSKQILDTRFEGEYKIAVITNNFHIYRGASIAKNEGFENITHMHARLQWYNLLPCYLRESLAVIKMWVIG